MPVPFMGFISKHMDMANIVGTVNFPELAMRLATTHLSVEGLGSFISEMLYSELHLASIIFGCWQRRGPRCISAR